jgi:hypothetical protein
MFFSDIRIKRSLKISCGRNGKGTKVSVKAKGEVVSIV